jgi:putative transposase
MDKPQKPGISSMELKRNRNSVYQIGYHLVWCVKYRKQILTGQIAEDMRELLQKISNDNNFTIEELEVMPDHVHLFVTATPNHLIADMVKALKGVSARFLFKKHPDLKNQLWGGHLWNPSYYVGTIGHISEETVKKYIESQKVGE